MQNNNNNNNNPNTSSKSNSYNNGDTIYLKSGDSMGESSIICYNRTKNWGIIILLNQRNSKMRQDLLNKIYDTILK